ncbi:MAG: 3-oxoacyl-[acyl-carrier-protein] synthase [Thermotogaceae bacterium]|jgi:3-oxoacyl-[acyl-carrier-protein] synthase II|nr:3-oxoacyl-[acyl-carrier-protein] synthase [Thermotogaceae bacterium]
MKKIVITGLGTINPVAKNTNEFSTALREEKSGIDVIKSFDSSTIPVKIAGEVKDFSPKLYMDRRKAKKFDRFLQLGLAATKEAFEDAGLNAVDDWKESGAVTVSSGIGGVHTEMREFYELYKNGPRYVSPFLIPMIITNMMAGVIAMEYGLNGPNFAPVSACASSLHSLIIGAMLIETQKCDVAITGGVDAAVTLPGIIGFSNMMALSKRNDTPEKASRPFDKERDGFVMSEGSGVIILESEEHALKRNAPIYGYLLGYGMSADAHDYSASDPNGKGPALAIKRALDSGKISVDQIDLINTHGTGTPIGDNSEGKAIQSVFVNHKPLIQSTKSLIGHTIAGSGSIETIAGILQAKEGFVHGMPNLKEPDDNLKDLNFVYQKKEQKIKTFMKNSFGFGGQNASIIVEVV